MSKKIISVLLSVLLIGTALCACAKKPTENTTTEPGSFVDSNDEKLSVITTIFPAYDFVRQIAGDKVKLQMLMKPGGEVHSYSPSADDMLAISKCDLLISVGGESDEDWVDDTIESSGNTDLVSLPMITCVQAVEEELKEGMEAEPEEEEKVSEQEVEYDEHIWTSPKNAKLIVSSIAKALANSDAKNADFYLQNAKKYSETLDGLDAQLHQIAEASSCKTLIFADRFPFRYFCEEYGFDYFAAFNGCSASADPSAETINFLIEKVKQLKVPCIFTIEFSTGATADTISEATGIKRAELHSCHNVSQEDFDNNVSYVDLMQRNIETLKTVLLDAE